VSRTIGLDLSLTATGICVMGAGGHVELSCIVGSKPEPCVLDTLRFSRQARQIMHECRPKPTDLIVIEDYAYAAPGQITRLAEFAGTVKYMLLEEYDIPQERICLCHNGTLKKFLTGKGNAEKQLVLMKVLQRWNTIMTNDNLADAFGLAMLGHLALGGGLGPAYPHHCGKGLSALEQECLDKFKSGCVLWLGGSVPVKKSRRKKASA
jgi:crossover junction endodeoxyribonuclease RuvC